MKRALMDYPEFRAAHAAFHKRWTAAVGTPGYDKARWKAEERELIDHWRKHLGLEEAE